MKSKIRSPFAWTRTKVTWVSILALIVTLAFTEWTRGTYTILSTYFLADFDSATTGTVINSRVVSRPIIGTPGGYEYEIRYSYEVEGQEFTGNLVYLGLHRETWREDAQEIATKYTAGRNVKVFYDSMNPRYSVLENSGLDTEYAVTTIFLFFLIPTLIWFFYRLDA